MKKIITLMMLFSMLFTVNALAKTTGSPSDSNPQSGSPILKLDNRIGLWGYTDAKDNWIIKPQFFYAKEFSCGRALVEVENNGVYRYIDESGTLLKGEYSRGTDYKDGHALVKFGIVNHFNRADSDLTLNVIDTAGNVVLKTKYHLYDTTDIEGILAIITPQNRDYYTGLPWDLTIGFITTDLKVIAPQYKSSNLITHDSFTYIDQDLQDEHEPNILILPDGSLKSLPGTIDSFDSDLNLGVLRIVNKKSKTPNHNSRFAFFTPDGKIVDSIISDKTSKKHPIISINTFKEGYSVVGIIGAATENRTTYRYVDTHLKVLDTPDFSQGAPFSEGFAAVEIFSKENYSAGIIKKDGSYLLAPKGAPRFSPPEKFKGFFTSPNHTEEEFSYVENKITELTSSLISDDMDDMQKIEALYQYVLNSTVYAFGRETPINPNGMDDYHEAIGILKKGRGVCDAYANLLGMLLTEAGFECRIISGDITNRDFSAHAWLLVKLDGAFYHLDPTWDDGVYYGQFKYFFVSDRFMENTRVWDQDDYPKCPKGYFNDKTYTSN